MNELTILKGAKQILLRKGWCQQVFFDLQGRLCLVGAIDNASATSDGRIDPQMRQRAFEAIAQTIRGPNLFQFNDDTRMTKEIILNTLDTTIERLEAQSGE